MHTRRTVGQEFVWWIVLLVLAGVLCLLLAAPAP